MSIEELKARSRLALHRKMSRSASYYADTELVPVTIDVRTFYQGKRVGDLAGTNLSYAEQLEHPTELVFWNEDVPASLDRGDRVIFSATEGYVIDVLNPKDGYTTKAEVSPLSESKLQGLTLPDGSVIGA